MDTNVNYTIVGLFVISLVAATTLGIIWLSSGFSMQQFKTYQVFMQESVSGLSPDSPVEFNGVNVGSVKKVELDDKNPNLVTVFLSVENGTPISQGTTATIASKGLTGIAFIALKDKGEDKEPLTTLPGQQYPVIKTAPSLFLRLDQALNSLSENLRKVTDDISALLNKDNLESIKETLANMQRVTATIANNSKQIDTILHSASSLSQRLEPLIQSSASTMRILEIQTLPATYRLLTNLDNASRSLAETTAEIKQNPAIIIRGVNRNNYGPGELK